jgi:alkylation response protein AidB-like acyl-CoA dehydrogenase
MDFALQAVSDAGRAFVSLCEGHEADFASRAARHDREGSFPAENIADLVRSGVTAATVPAELGGLGVASLRDHAAGMSRLGRGDGSTASP